MPFFGYKTLILAVVISGNDLVRILEDEKVDQLALSFGDGSPLGRLWVEEAGEGYLACRF